MFIRLCFHGSDTLVKCISEGNKLCYAHQVVFSCSDTLVKCISEDNNHWYVHQFLRSGSDISA